MAFYAGVEVMHQYELMRLVSRLANELAVAARTPEARALADEAARMTSEWNTEEREYIDAITRHED